MIEAFYGFQNQDNKKQPEARGGWGLSAGGALGLAAAGFTAAGLAAAGLAAAGLVAAGLVAAGLDAAGLEAAAGRDISCSGSVSDGMPL